MSSPQYWTKDPDSTLDWAINWAPSDGDGDPWLEDGETITDSEWLVPAGLTKVTDEHTDTTAIVWLSGGTLGETYLLTNRITTSAGRTEDRSRTLLIEEH